MTTGRTELREAVDCISWWLDPVNSETRRQLAQHNPELAAWLDMIERKVNEKMKQAEAQAEGEKTMTTV